MRPNNFDKMITIYGRNAVWEALSDETLQIATVHLAESNKPAAILRDIQNQCTQRSIEVQHHTKQQLSRISKNGKQDQGIAADIIHPFLYDIQQLDNQPPKARLLACDKITNPQNLGMIIRAACAGGIDGLILPKEKGNTKISPLVIKASAGTLFKLPIYSCSNLEQALYDAKPKYRVVALAGNTGKQLEETAAKMPTIYVLGNETEGVSAEVLKASDVRCFIPMQNGVESLNVAVCAGLVAYLT